MGNDVGGGGHSLI